MTAEELSKQDNVNVEEQGNMFRLSTSEGYEFKCGEDRSTVLYCLKTSDLVGYEVVEALPQEAATYTQEEYEEKVNTLIRNKYSLSEELAILRQQQTKTAEYQAYYDYCEQCKAEAKALLAEEQRTNDNGDSGKQ